MSLIYGKSASIVPVSFLQMATVEGSFHKKAVSFKA